MYLSHFQGVLSPVASGTASALKYVVFAGSRVLTGIRLSRYISMGMASDCLSFPRCLVNCDTIYKLGDVVRYM
jgi:hypothetical protein